MLTERMVGSNLSWPGISNAQSVRVPFRDGPFQLVWKLRGCNPLPSQWMLLVYMDLLPTSPLSLPLAMQKGAITFILARSESWQIVGKWLFERQSHNRQN